MESRKRWKNVGNETKFAIVHMSKKGIKQFVIVKYFGISKTTISMILKKFSAATIGSKKWGPKYKLNEAAIRILKRVIIKNNMKPLYLSVTEFKEDCGYKIYIKTIRKYIHKCGIRNYAAASKPYLMPHHILNRERWAYMRKNWSMYKLATVAFSDESKFTLKTIALRKRVWRKQLERYKTIKLVPTFKSGYQSISVSAASSICGRTRLIRIEGNLNQHKYIEILKSNLLPFAQQYHVGTGNIIFQQDGCDPDRGMPVKAYLDGEDIKVLPWPAQIPDMNPIENPWAILKRNLRKESAYPTSKAELFEKVIWSLGFSAEWMFWKAHCVNAQNSFRVRQGKRSIEEILEIWLKFSLRFYWHLLVCKYPGMIYKKYISSYLCRSMWYVCYYLVGAPLQS